MLRYRFIAVGVLLTLLAADTAGAGLFGFGRRRWERRKAELRAELVYDLENKLDQDLAREVDAITAQLTATAESQVKIEAEKLQQQVQQALVQLREEASKVVAAEAKRLDQEIDKQVAELKAQTQQLAKAEAAKLKKQADQEITALTAKLNKQSQTLRSTVAAEIAKLPAQINQQIEKSLKQFEAKKTSAGAPETPANQGKPNDPKNPGVSATQSEALPSKEVALAETAQGDTVGQ